MASRFDTIVNAATLVACVAVVVTLYRLPRPSKPPEHYKSGDVIAGLDRALFEKSDKTVVIALRDGCKYCEASMPFYQALLRRHHASNAGTTRFVALVLAERDPAHAARYVQANALAVDETIVTTPAQEHQLKLFATPTLLIASRGGVVQRNWIGQLPPAAEQDVHMELFGSKRALAGELP